MRSVHSVSHWHTQRPTHHSLSYSPLLLAYPVTGTLSNTLTRHTTSGLTRPPLPHSLALSFTHTRTYTHRHVSLIRSLKETPSVESGNRRVYNKPGSGKCLSFRQTSWASTFMRKDLQVLRRYERCNIQHLRRKYCVPDVWQHMQACKKAGTARQS